MARARTILIVGGGIAGLSLAALLRRAGAKPLVVEKAPEWRPVGAGIVVAPNALVVLAVLGVDRAVRELGRELRELEITDQNGVTLQRLAVRPGRRRLPPMVALHRADLHQALLSACGEVEIRLGTTVDTLEPRSRAVRARLTDGTEADFDLVVGADGVHSSIRKRVFPSATTRRAGYAAWRTVIDIPDFHRTLEMWGRGCRFGAVPIGGDRVYCFAVVNAPPGLPDPPEQRIERVRASFEEFGGPAQALLARLSEPDRVLYDDIVEVFSPMAGAYGRVALIGDAAHAMTPNLGQGAAMAIEDAWILARRLADRASIEKATAAFQAQRQPRVRSVRRLSRLFGEVGQWRSTPAVIGRAALLRAVPARLASWRLEALMLRERELPFATAPGAEPGVWAGGEAARIG